MAAEAAVPSASTAHTPSEAPASARGDGANRARQPTETLANVKAEEPVARGTAATTAASAPAPAKSALAPLLKSAEAEVTYAPSIIDTELEVIARKIRCRTPEIARSVDNALMHLLGDLLRPTPAVDLSTQPEEDEDMPETGYDDESGAEDDVATPGAGGPVLALMDPRRGNATASTSAEQQRLLNISPVGGQPNSLPPSATMLPTTAAPGSYSSKSTMPPHFASTYGAAGYDYDDDDIEAVEEEEEEDEAELYDFPDEPNQYDIPAQSTSSAVPQPPRRKASLPQKRPKYAQSAGKGLLQQPTQRASTKKGSSSSGGGGGSAAAAAAAAYAHAAEVSATGKLYTPPSAKPFACPTPGCNARYKQANGLKYHRLKGKCSTTEIVQAASGKEAKPFLCHDVTCGKRYKNLNGLRYHYQHSGSHGIIGSQLLQTNQHPPPQRGGSALRYSVGPAHSARAGSAGSSGSGGY